LDWTTLFTRAKKDGQDCLAMIVGRIVYAGSKLALSNQWKNTALWELCGVEGKVDVEEHCYLPMERLLERHSAQIGSSSSPGWSLGALRYYQRLLCGRLNRSDIVTFGYNRDCKRGHEQMVIALLCSAEGCPVGSRSLCW
jgi:hypothetical protein